MMDGGSAWEDKNLDYLVSPDQAGEANAQFSSRQQREKALVGSSIASPPQEKGSSSLTADNEANQPTHDPTSTLKQELHILVTATLEDADEKAEGATATREKVLDEQGRIIDVLFNQNGNEPV